MNVQQTIGRYQIISEIGRGGMASVYRAHDPRFSRDVAVKVLPQAFLHDPTFRSRFEREARTIAALEHMAIVPVYDFGEHQGQPYLVMRLMTGGSLAQRLRRGPLTIAQATEILQRIGSALDKAHQQGIVHRDLKPDNILFDQDDNAYLSDFGIVKLSESTASLTGSNIIGTPAYMSPEQARGEGSIDRRSDIYALGAILFEILTGEQPYKADTPMGVVVKHITEPVPRIREVRPDLRPECEEIIRTAMAKERGQRFPTAGEMSRALATLGGGSSGPAHPPAAAAADWPPPPPTDLSFDPPVQPGRRGVPLWIWGVVAVVLLCLLAGGAAGAWVFFGPDAATPTAVVQATMTTTATTGPEAAATTSVPIVEPTTTPTFTATAEPVTPVTPTTAPPQATATATPTAVPPAPASDEVQAYQVTTPPVIDGFLSEWGAYTPVESEFLVFSGSGWDGSRDMTARWRLLWDANRLYIGVEVFDNLHVQTQSGNQIFLGDSVDMQIDTDLDGDFGPGLSPDDFQIIFSPGNFTTLSPSAFRFRGTTNGRILDEPGHSVTVAAQQTASGYSLEAAIPWSDLDLSPFAGLVIGLALNASDNDRPGEAVQEVLMSNSAERTLTDPTGWGTLTLR